MELNSQKSTLLLILITFFVISCNNDEALKDNNDPTAFQAPVTKSFTLTEPKTIEWEVTDPDSIAPPKIYPLDIDKIPSLPFGINEPTTLTSPMKEYALDIDQLPVIPLEFDTVPFTLKESLIPKPVIKKMGKPSFIEGKTSGLIQLSEAEGLPSNEIKVIIENDDGSFWIATHQGGLCFYNGEEIYIYGYYGILDLVKDKDGKLWMATSKGIYMLDFIKNMQTNLLVGQLIYDLYCDKENNIWINHWNKRTLIMNAERTQLRKINADFDLILRIWEDEDQNIWIGDYDHISIIGKDRTGFRKIEDTENYQIGLASTFFEDHRGNVWIDSRKDKQHKGIPTLSDRGLLSISLKDKTVRTLDQENGFNGYAVKYQEDDLGRLWIFQNDTAFIMDADRTKFKTISTNASLSTNFRFGYSMKDKRGHIWLGTHNRGVILIDPNGPMHESVLLAVHSFEEDVRGNIWMGTYKGLNIYNPHTGQIKKVPHESLQTTQANVDKRLFIINEYEKDKILIDAGVGFSIIDRAKNVLTQYGNAQGFDTKLRNFTIDEFKNFWFSTNDGLYVFNEGTNQVKKITTNSDLISGSRTTDIIVDGFGHYWIATDAGLVIIDPEDDTIQYLNESEGLCHNDVIKILLQDERYLWVATMNGLSIVDIVDHKITNLGENEGLIPDELHELREKDGYIYIGSADGLIQTKMPPIMNSKWHFHNYGNSQAFRANNYVQGASMLQENGQLWFSAVDIGFIPEVTVLTQGMKPDTTLCPIAITSVHIMDENQSFTRWGELLPWGNSNDTIWSDDEKQYEVVSTLPGNSEYLREKNIQYDSLSDPYKMPIGLTLPYDQNYLKFSFANPCVLNKDNISYRYMLKGADDGWIYSGQESDSKYYFNLSAGDYTFKVSTKGIINRWGDTAEFSFKIIPPWWRTWWAYLVYTLLIIGGIRAIVQYRSRKLKKENRLLEEKVTLRTNELQETIGNLQSTQAQLIQSEKMASLGELTAGIAHEIQNPLNFVNNFSEVSTEMIEEVSEEIESGDMEEAKEILKDLKGNLEKITHHGQRASGIVKSMLDHSRTGSGEKIETDINQLAEEYLKLAYHGMRAKDSHFNAHFEFKPDSTIPKINIVAQDISRVLLNLINNAFQALSTDLPSEDLSKGGAFSTDEASAESVAKEEGSDKPLTGFRALSGVVKVSTKNLGDQIQITISDNGPGIPDDIKDKIFQPFFTTKPTGQGTGLGLSLSYDIVKAHGGELEVESKEGEGTAFNIILPLI